MTRAERKFAWIRAAFVFVVFSVFITVSDRSQSGFFLRAGMEGLVFTIGAGASAWTLLTTRRRNLTHRHILIIAGLDALLCIASLGSSGVDPVEAYPGVFGSLDVGVALLIPSANIFRTSRPAVLFSSGLFALGLTGIVYMDAVNGRSVPTEKLILFCVYAAGVLGSALLATNLAQENTRAAAEDATSAERAKSSVLTLLHEYHDLRSILFELRLNAERIAEAAGRNPETVERLAGRLTQSVDGLSNSLTHSRDRALIVMRGFEQPSPTNIGTALELVRNQTERFQVDIKAPDPQLVVGFGGGVNSLSLLLTHLVENAFKGSERGRATKVRISTKTNDRENVWIEVEDDGPGFRASELESLGTRPAPRSKEGSSGVGLWLAARALEGVGGSLELENAPQGGALVRLRLPQLQSWGKSGPIPSEA